MANGTKGTLNGSGNYYTLEVTPNGTNDVEVSVRGNVVKDAAETYIHNHPNSLMINDSYLL